MLLLGAAGEELLPKVLGVGFPILLAVVQLEAARKTVVEFMLFAVAAGAVEDALSSLPFLTSVSFFLLVATVIHWTSLPRAAILLTYPVYQLWLMIWVPSMQGGIYGRLLVSLPFGAVAALGIAGIVFYCERKAALDEAE